MGVWTSLLYFLDSSVESHFESLLAGLELGEWVGIELLSTRFRPVKKRGGVITILQSFLRLDRSFGGKRQKI